ncbi:hypothetical protein B0H17DRAFT_1088868 [Mycena rosella]|uniref:Uncharacterized protein n=1 Tax=Mycena rosella TaxID=1033263 RepID=A0AAD7CWU5_MYCRO|nr:hypothetical protein B0H17DRAFT_1088868 [Mycena rosella]
MSSVHSARAKRWKITPFVAKWLAIERGRIHCAVRLWRTGPPDNYNQALHVNPSDTAWARAATLLGFETRLQPNMYSSPHTKKYGCMRVSLTLRYLYFQALHVDPLDRWLHARRFFPRGMFGC